MLVATPLFSCSNRDYMSLELGWSQLLFYDAHWQLQ